MAKRVGIQALRPGYVYVLATTYQKGDAPVIKVGMTSRTPDKRAAELSRGGPSRMTLVGFVTSQNAGALERMAHTRFANARVSGGGGTEYFAVDPQEVLTWLRSKTPRFELETATQAAWSELFSYEVRGRSNYGAVCFGAGMLGAFPGGIIAEFLHSGIWTAMGAVVAFVAACMFFVPKARAEKRIRQAELAELKVQLELQYNLPVGTLSPKRS